MKTIYCVKCAEEITKVDDEGLQDANTKEATIKVFCDNCGERYLLVYTLVAVRPI